MNRNSNDDLFNKSMKRMELQASHREIPKKNLKKTKELNFFIHPTFSWQNKQKRHTDLLRKKYPKEESSEDLFYFENCIYEEMAYLMIKRQAPKKEATLILERFPAFKKTTLYTWDYP